MKIYPRFSKEAVHALTRGGVGIVPTDTIYGISGLALRKRTVEKIYRLRKRNPKKPMIVLIGSLADLKKFGVRLRHSEHALLTRLWPGKVSVVLPCRGRKFAYLHRGRRTLAFRMPAWKPLAAFLKITGPLVSTSVNPEGKPPATSIREARKYYGNRVAFYIDKGRLASAPSTLVALARGRVAILRQGAARIRGTKQ
ncbi:MAG: threonylcarbamoyl-AMP synthase [Candidatus Liptonbacteria bacterium RIFCSPLOWO2_01_FULL_56_20]|uniref:L-threonylcarbamoyladenylate synthase n=1 Tax=Candidatus Liptonbacteria bacterium RIFCSPLOWO2_01_FULL_56_20 TaxID=1798652 RepID=A0A1G2CJS6_9BACT|nr:MAG: threonylcarbamoyl-AMP synthase [Candidatus Liptonbacteria bacterium RIFCSPHIGHO2_01_FULL_56_18b]OGZ00911.1 MAG: threonylcarbamoyl-AMP synthase [Candidatus Liptonbacteria bacterium RIFCSPLOWO2_01_FULL_56_20]